MFNSRQELINYIKEYYHNSTEFIPRFNVLLDCLIKFNLLKFVVDKECNDNKKIFGITIFNFNSFDGNITYYNYCVVYPDKMICTKIVRSLQLCRNFITKELIDKIFKIDYGYELVIPSVRSIENLHQLITENIVLPSNITLNILISTTNTKYYDKHYYVIKYLVLNYLSGNKNITFKDNGLLCTWDSYNIPLRQIIQDYKKENDLASLQALRKVIENDQIKNFNMEKLCIRSQTILQEIGIVNIKSAMTILE